MSRSSAACVVDVVPACYDEISDDVSGGKSVDAYRRLKRPEFGLFGRLICCNILAGGVAGLFELLDTICAMVRWAEWAT